MQQNELKFTGGARIGNANATWPFAILTVNAERLTLSSFVGHLVFKPSDIVSILPYWGIFSGGLKISHTVSSYPENVIFWTRKADRVLDQIGETGFLTNAAYREPGAENSIIRLQSSGVFPVKKSVAIGFAIIWNLLFIAGSFLIPDKRGLVPIRGIILAFGFLLFSCLLLFVSKPFQRFALKEGHTIKEIQKFLFFLIYVSGLILFVMIMSSIK